MTKYTNFIDSYILSENRSDWNHNTPGEGVVFSDWNKNANIPICKSQVYTLYDIKNKKQAKAVADNNLRRALLDAHKCVTRIKQEFSTNLTFEYEKSNPYDVMLEKSILGNEALFNRCEEHLEDRWTEWFTIGVSDSNVINTSLFHHVGFRNKEDKLKFILLM